VPLIDNQVTRFPNGLTNVAVDNIFNALKSPDPTIYTRFFDDFFDFVPTAWTVTETQAGATQATAAFSGGALALVNSAADNDINQVQKNFGSFLPVVGKKFFMKCRFQLSDATQTDLAIGIQIVNADGTTLATATDGIFFLKADDAATVALYVRKDNAAGSANSGAIATVVAATNIELACFYDGIDRLYYAVNGVIGGYIDAVTATFLPDVACAPIISLKNGEAVAKTATVDYLFIAQEK
jgi:hypothetical protein